MISRQRFDAIKQQYGHYASWAVWCAEGERTKDGVGDISFLDNPTDKLLNVLNPEIILVGLNISGAIKRPFGNFHSDNAAAQDYKLRFALHETSLWGGYLTDIIKDFEEKIAGNVTAYLRRNPEFEKQNIKIFQEELEAIGATSPTLVALGSDSYAILMRNLGDHFSILKAPHYAMYISKENYRRRFEDLSAQNS